uniref:ATP synthase complex subunit 8 n=1 Tax=Phelsuma laticauda TaxID=143529 RepID=K9JW24_9SAUR|nr:ATPase subunit 8 [Phelsuma laticauda]
MPQLDPTPWLKTLTIIWLVLLFIVQPTVMKSRPINKPQPRHTNYKTTPWPYPWR